MMKSHYLKKKKLFLKFIIPAFFCLFFAIPSSAQDQKKDPKQAITLEGEYRVEGRAANGANYDGILTVESYKDIYKFEMLLNKKKISGVGTLTEKKLTVIWNNEKFVYEIQKDGSILSRWGEGKGEENYFPLKKKEKQEDKAVKQPQKSGTAVKIMKGMIPKYEQKKDEKLKKTETSTVMDEADASAIKESASEDLRNILVLLCEYPITGKNEPIYAPIFMKDEKQIFGTRTDFSFKWVGYKLTFGLKQNKFPWGNTTLEEYIIGSFLYASGTNLGFIREKFKEDIQFYTNYTNEIIVFKWKIVRPIALGFGLDSRQYFFIKKQTPEGFIMPEDHVNIFPHLILDLGVIKTKGIDLLTDGFMLSNFAGYGIRSSWKEWGEPGDLQTGARAQKFVIFSSTLSLGILFGDDQNIVLRARFKGGLNNDFLSRPRFGGTIDNANLDVVHGFTLDEFRVYQFGLVNFKYGFNIVKRLRLNALFDYAHIFSSKTENIIGTGYDIRIIAIGGLPIWFTHGFGKKLSPVPEPWQQTFMIMTAAGW